MSDFKIYNSTNQNANKSVHFGKKIQNEKITNSVLDIKKKEFDKDIVEIKTENKNTPITFKEGASLLAQGFKDKLKTIATCIIKHPVKTAAMVLATTALMGAMPLVGISSLAAGSAMALLYAGVAIGKTAYHSVNFVKNNMNQNYNEARENLKSMGGDTIDLALSIPFVPKAFKNVKDFAKYGKIGVNHVLISDIKTAKGFKAKFKVLRSGNVKISEDINFKKAIEKFSKTPEDIAEFQAMRNLAPEEFTNKVFQKIAKDMNVSDIAPGMKFSEDMPSNMMGGFNNGTCSIEFNAGAFRNMKQSEIINTVRHELEHYQQFVDIARYKGADYIVELQARAYLDRIKTGNTSSLDFSLSSNKKFIEINGEEMFIQEAVKSLKDKKAINVEAYQKAIDKLGIIKPQTQEALQAQQYIDAVLKYPDLSLAFFTPPDTYTNNILEVKAREAGKNPSGKIGEYKIFTEEMDKIKPADTFLKDTFVSVSQSEVITEKN